MSEPVAIVVLGARGAGLARRLAESLPAARVHAPDCAACPAEVRFASWPPTSQGAFRGRVPIVGSLRQPAS